jgi:hypothetical protein
MYKIQKKVRFSDTFVIGDTYSSDDYDRSTIDSLVYRRARYGTPQIEMEFRLAIVSLNLYKMNEMTIHPASITNTNLKR